VAFLTLDSGPGDQISYGTNGFNGVKALHNGNYVVASPNWNGQRGAATWGDGTAGVTGPVGATNSLVGSNPGDQVSSGGFLGGVTALANGNYVVASPKWNDGRGAATWGDGTAGVTGTIDVSNSLVGSNSGDYVGGDQYGFIRGVTALANGNYVVASPDWSGNRGAATWGGTTGVTGTIDTTNSLVGSNPADQVGSGGVTALGNGTYVVASPHWNNNSGAATWGDGTAGVTGPVDPGNSLVG
jgi:hypothetical protein